jgi:hypothetical protein
MQPRRDIPKYKHRSWIQLSRGLIARMKKLNSQLNIINILPENFYLITHSHPQLSSSPQKEEISPFSAPNQIQR